MKSSLVCNLPSITEADQQRLADAHILVIGCGGLGCHVIDQLVRLGIGAITVMDPDVFQVSNLNRQLYCTRKTLGRYKVTVARERALEIDPDVKFSALREAFVGSLPETGESGNSCDLVIDCLDNVPCRLLLEDTCREARLPLIHGAINGWCMQACVCMPGENRLHELYAASGSAQITESADPAPNSTSTLSFTPALCASVQTSLAVRALLGDIETTLILLDLK